MLKPPNAHKPRQCHRAQVHRWLDWPENKHFGSKKGWVADDEMDYYMYMLESYHPGSTYGVVHLPDNPDRDAMLVKWILAALTQAHQDINSQVKVLVFLHKEHWIPCFVEADGDVPRVHVPCIEYDWIIHAFQEVVAGHAISFTSSPMPHAFEADCGFQAVGMDVSKTHWRRNHAAVHSETGMPMEKFVPPEPAVHR